MKKALVVLHTGLSPKARIGKRGFAQVESLFLDGSNANLEIKLRNIERRIVANLSALTRDLLEVAAVLYVADTSISRGKTDVYGEDWARHIHIVMPVRQLKKWRKCKDILSELATYLSGDASITFDFRPHQKPRSGQGYLEFPAEDSGFRGANEIVLFSGGLDSLAGAVGLVSQAQTPLLVSHRSSPTRTQLQESLVKQLSVKAGSYLPSIGVWVTRKDKEAADNNQRLRAFLYMALAAIAAYELQINSVYYCENGVTTLNLPLSDQRIGSRSTRTTHPRVMKLFSDFAAALLQRPIQFCNPFVFCTKRDVVERLIQGEHGDLIGAALSCTRTFAVEKTKRHCGYCFQCLTRRFAVAAANAEHLDPIDDYVKDVFTSPLAKGVERANAIDWINFNLFVSQLSPEGLFHQFPQLHQALASLPGDPQQNVRHLYDMFQRNAEDVKKALASKHMQHYSDVLSGQLSPDSLLALIGSGAHRRPSVVDFMTELEAKLSPRLRERYLKGDPAGETELQREAEIILKAAGYDMERESPQFTFAIVKTRPDFSFPVSGVFLELKLFDAEKKRTAITDGILADIPKYQTKCQGMLFLVYQTKAFISEPAEFARTLSNDPRVQIKVIG